MNMPMALDTCTTTGKALAIVGLILGIVGLGALGFVFWNMRRQRSARGWRPQSPSPASERSVTPAYEKDWFKPKVGFVEKWRTGVGGNQRSDMASKARGPPKESISKPSRISMWPPFWRRTSDRLSFKDVGGPSLPTNNMGGGRAY